MSAAIKRMQAERAQREAYQEPASKVTSRRDERCDAIMELIDQAAPFLDAGPVNPKAWRPSAQLKIGYLVIATSETLGGAELRAERFVSRTLHRARNLYREGFYANPFALAPLKREINA